MEFLARAVHRIPAVLGRTVVLTVVTLACATGSHGWILMNVRAYRSIVVLIAAAIIASIPVALASLYRKRLWPAIRFALLPPVLLGLAIVPLSNLDALPATFRFVLAYLGTPLLWLLCLAAALALPNRATVLFRRADRCGWCRYDLSASPGRTCSECGSTEVEQYRPRFGRWYVSLLLWIAGGLAAWGVFCAVLVAWQDMR